jgi:peptide/nickel transport system substrate-binding protein
VHLEAEPPHLNPLQDQLAVIDRVVGGLVYETLLECRGNQYQPGLAESWEVSPDGERITLKLRHAARWHDDRVVSGMDVQASLEPLLRSGNKSILRTILVDVEGVDVVPGGARLRLLRRSDLVLRALCEIPILPAEGLRTAPTQLGRQPVGTGPFKFASWERGKRIRLVRSRPAEKPQPPFLDEIVFEIDNDVSRALLRTRRGEIDILPRLLEAHYPEQVTPATLRDSLDLYWLKPDRYTFIVPNHRRGPLSDPRMRQALSLLWDRARFAQEFHRGTVVPIGAPTFGNVPADRFDRALAMRLLEDAGFRDTDGDGVRDVGGVPIRLSFLVPTGSRTLASEVKAYALDLHRAGLLLDTVVVDAGVITSRLEKGEFDRATLTWEGAPDEDARVLFGSEGPIVISGAHVDGALDLLEQLRVASGPQGRAPILQKLAERLATQRPLVFLYRHDVPALVANRVHGLAGMGDRLDLRAVWVTL